MARERCTSLCTKPTTGTCKLCDALDERDAFVWWLFMPERWIKHLGRDVAADGGYRIVIGIVVTLAGAYFGLYAIVEARHERHLNRALFERSAFMTLVVTGPSGFRSAMDQFAQIQNQKAPIEPDLSLPPWKWFGEYRPNRESLRQWALIFMVQCEPKTCGTLAQKDETGRVKENSKSWRINLQNAHLEIADLRGANLTFARLTIAHLEGANLRGADLMSADLRGAHLRGAHLRNAHLRNAHLEGADLRNTDLGLADLEGAYLLGANNLTQRQIDAACVYENTTLPEHIKRPDKNPERCRID